jgi:hypothetical protein
MMIASNVHRKCQECVTQAHVSMSRFNERGSVKRAIEYRMYRSLGLTHDEAQQMFKNGYISNPTPDSLYSKSLLAEV